MTEVPTADNKARVNGEEYIRGGTEKKVTLLAARLVVKSQGKTRIALKYEGETEYRFLVATDLPWRHKDIAIAYSFSRNTTGFLKFIQCLTVQPEIDF